MTFNILSLSLTFHTFHFGISTFHFGISMPKRFDLVMELKLTVKSEMTRYLCVIICDHISQESLRQH